MHATQQVKIDKHFINVRDKVMEMNKAQKIVKKHPMIDAGWEQVNIPSQLLDSIWQKDNMLHIKFATGQECTFMPTQE